MNRNDLQLVAIQDSLWLYSPDYEDWRFVLASRQLDATEPSEAYGLVHDALAAAGTSLEQTPPLTILKMSDPFITSIAPDFR